METGICSHNYETLLNLLFAGLLDTSEVLSLNIASAPECLALPQKDSRSHYRNELEFMHPTTASYSTFLSAIQSRESRIPSLFDMIAIPFPPQQIIVETLLVVYLKRFMVELEYPSNNTLSEENEFGYISSVMYGQRFYLDIVVNTTLPSNMRIEEFLEKLYGIVRAELTDQDYNKKQFDIKLNLTAWEQNKQENPISMPDCSVDDVLDLVKKWKMGITAKGNFLEDVPIAVEMSRFGTNTPVPFHFTQCVTTTLPPLHVLILLSNVLLIGTVLALIISLFFLLFCCYAIIGMMAMRLLEIGRVSLPSFVRVVPYQIFLIYLWPPENAELHQHQD